jgi:hypothetical protein
VGVFQLSTDGRFGLLFPEAIAEQDRPVLGEVPAGCLQRGQQLTEGVCGANTEHYVGLAG